MPQLPGERPFSRTALAKLRDPYEVVASTFSSVHYSWLSGRGGIDRPDQRPRATRITSKHKPPQGLHVESTFNEAQREYIGLCVAGLNKLTRGEIFLSTTQLPTLTNRIEQHFLEDGSAKYLFRRSVALGTIEVFDAFGLQYPNLTPALAGMTTVAGKQGTILAVQKSGELLEFALKQQQGDTIQHLVPELAGNNFYARRNYGRADGKPLAKPLEIWCLGEAFARSIIRSAGEAALKLANVPGVGDLYSPSQNFVSAFDPWIGDQVEASVQRSLEAAQAALPNKRYL